jgi:hypothetical protein
MATSCFDDKTRAPDDARLSAALGKAFRHWQAILAHLEAARPGLAREWKFYGAKLGWQLKVADRKRAVVYLVPHEGGFLAAMALSDAAVAAVRASRALPAELVREIEAAKQFPEGRPARVEVTAARHAETVKQLLSVKLQA